MENPAMEYDNDDYDGKKNEEKTNYNDQAGENPDHDETKSENKSNGAAINHTEKTQHGANNTPQEESAQKSEKVDSSPEEAWVPPDGGYGWVIVLGSFLLWFEFGQMAQSGIFMLRIAPEFNATNTQFSGLNSVQSSLGLLLGMFLGPLIGYFGCRPMLVLGTALLSSGYIISCFVSSIEVMYLTYGVLPSLGVGIFYCCTVVTVNQYFVKNTAKANALALSGFNVSTFAWPPLGAWMCDSFGWRYAFLIEGIWHAVVGTVCVIILKPPGHKQTFCLMGKNKVDFPPNNTNIETDKNKKSSCKTWLFHVIDFRPLRDVTLDLFFIGMWLYQAGHFGNAWYVPVRSELLDISPQTAAFHASVLGVVSAVTTLLYAPLGDLKCVSKLAMFAAGNILAAIFTLTSAAMTTSTHFYIYAAILGVIEGIYLSVDIACYVEVCGVERLASATGWYSVVTGLSPLTLHAISGPLLDNTGDPNSSFYLSGVSQLLGGILFGLVAYRRRNASIDDVIDEIPPDLGIDNERRPSAAEINYQEMRRRRFSVPVVYASIEQPKSAAR